LLFKTFFAYSIDGVLKYIINTFFKSHLVLKLEVGGSISRIGFDTISLKDNIKVPKVL